MENEETDPAIQELSIMIYALDGNAGHIKEQKFEWKYNKCSIL